VASTAARYGVEAAYGSIKGAMSRWVAGLAGGITVNALAPGLVPDTEPYGAGLDAETERWYPRGHRRAPAKVRPPRSPPAPLPGLTGGRVSQRHRARRGGRRLTP